MNLQNLFECYGILQIRGPHKLWLSQFALVEVRIGGGEEFVALLRSSLASLSAAIATSPDIEGGRLANADLANASPQRNVNRGTGTRLILPCTTLQNDLALSYGTIG